MNLRLLEEFAVISIATCFLEITGFTWQRRHVPERRIRSILDPVSKLTVFQHFIAVSFHFTNKLLGLTRVFNLSPGFIVRSRYFAKQNFLLLGSVEKILSTLGNVGQLTLGDEIPTSVGRLRMHSWISFIRAAQKIVSRCLALIRRISELLVKNLFNDLIRLNQRPFQSDTSLALVLGIRTSVKLDVFHLVLVRLRSQKWAWMMQHVCESVL